MSTAGDSRLRNRTPSGAVQVLRFLAPALLIFSFLFSPSGLGSLQTSPEYRVKALYLYNLLKFVDWHKTPVLQQQGSICVGVVGHDPFGSLLDETLRGKTVAGRPVYVRRFSKPEEVGVCHLLFVGSVEGKTTAQTLKSLRGKGTLTVGDEERFIEHGGIIKFTFENGSVGFEINPSAATRENLTLSPRLLQLAVIVPADQESR